MARRGLRRFLHTLVDTAGRDFRKLPHRHECTVANKLAIAECRQKCSNVTINSFTSEDCEFYACEVDCFRFVPTTYVGDCFDEQARYTTTVCGESFLDAAGCDRCAYCADCALSDLTIGFIIFGVCAALVVIPFVVWLVRRKLGRDGNAPRRSQLYAVN